MHQGELLRDILNAKRVNLTKLAPKIGMTRQNLYLVFEKNKIDAELLEAIKKETGIQIDLSDVNTSISEATPMYPPNKGNVAYVPLYAYGGFLSGYANKVFMDSLERYSYPGIVGEHYMFEVQGDSMKGFVSAGDRVIARPEERLEWMVKSRVYVLQTTDGILVKFFDHIKGDFAVFRSANKEYADIKIPLKSIKKIYQVVRVDKDPYKQDLETLMKKM